MAVIASRHFFKLRLFMEPLCEIQLMLQRMICVPPPATGRGHERIESQVGDNSYGDILNPPESTDNSKDAARDLVGIWCGAISGNMKVSFQAARSIG
jgi:hypothetical protein